MGYNFSDTFVRNLLTKYDPDGKGLSLDNFIVACVQIKRLAGIIVKGCSVIVIVIVIVGP